MHQTTQNEELTCSEALNNVQCTESAYMTMRRIVVNAPYPFEAEARLKHYRFSPYLEENTTRLQLKNRERKHKYTPGKCKFIDY
jgi:hypothetical protein